MLRKKILQASILFVLFSLLLGMENAQAGTSPIVLRYATVDRPESIIGKGQDWYLKRVEELTRGQVKFERYWSDTLVPMNGVLDALTTGVADAGLLSINLFPARFPLMLVNTLPTTYEDTYVFGMAMYDLIKQVPAVKEEVNRANIRYLTSIPFPAYMFLTRQPVNSLNDLKGLKIRTSGFQLRLIKELGAVGVTVTTPEVQTSLERGTIDGTTFPPLLIVDFGLHSAAKNFWKLSVGSNFSMLAMGQKAWDKIPASVQKILEETALEHAKAYHQIVQIEGNDKEAILKMKAEGVNVREAPEEAKARVRELSEPIWQNWIKDMEGKGLPSSQVADTYRSLLKKYQSLIPR